MAKTKATVHTGKGSAKHNEHDFIADHIDPNGYHHTFKVKNFADCNADTLTEYEINVYKKIFGAALQEQNNKYLAKRQYDRVKTMEDIYSDKRYMPDETIFQIGTMEQKDKYTADVLNKVYKDYLKKHNKLYGKNVILLDYSIHADEEGGVHIHSRQFYIYNEGGLYRYGKMAKALESLNLPLPNPNEKVGKYNNYKMSYTESCRQLFYEACREHGIEIDDTVKYPGKKRKSTLEYKMEQIQKKMEELEKERDFLANKNLELEERNKVLEIKNLKLKDEAIELDNSMQDLSDEWNNYIQGNSVISADFVKAFQLQKELEDKDKIINKYRKLMAQNNIDYRDIEGRTSNREDLQK